MQKSNKTAMVGIGGFLEKRHILSFLRSYFSSQNYRALCTVIKRALKQHRAGDMSNEFENHIRSLGLNPTETIDFFNKAKISSNIEATIKSLPEKYRDLYREYVRRSKPATHFGYAKGLGSEVTVEIYKKHGFFENCLGFFNVKAVEHNAFELAKRGVIIANDLAILGGMRSDSGCFYTHVYPILMDASDVNSLTNEEIQRIKGFDLIADGGLIHYTNEKMKLLDKYLKWGARDICFCFPGDDRTICSIIQCRENRGDFC